MAANGESIYGTQASPFKTLAWGRCTLKAVDGGARLYLHVFDWPADGKLLVPGIFNTPKKAFLLSDPKNTALNVSRKEDSLVISVPAACPDANDAVVVLEIAGAGLAKQPIPDAALAR
jgi:alpha-L-fucosidase